jgi:hypothetical protein
MDTIYYNVRARKVKVSGGADLLTFDRTPVAAPAGAPAGEVLDFARCRQRLETKAAWKELTDAACGDTVEEQPEECAAPARIRRGAGASNCLELCATLSVILVSLSAALAFLSLL